MTPRDVFISHSSEDAESARELRTILEGAGYSCWMAPDDIVGTDTWTEQILDAIHNSRAMIVLVSTAANASPHVSREVNLALGRKRAVLPIRIQAVAPGGSLEYLLSLVQRVDAFPPPVSNHRDRVLRRLEALLRSEEEEARAADAAGAAAAGAATVPTAPVEPTTPTTATRDAGGTTAGTSRTRVTLGPNRRPLIAGVGAVAVVAVAIAAWSLIGPGNPGASSAPTLAAAATGAATGATASNPATGVASTAAAGALSDEELAFFNRLPALQDPTACASWPTPPGGQDVLSPSGYAGSSARITCPGPNPTGPRIEYAFFPDTASLDAAYQGVTGSAGVAAGGACQTAIPANAPWSFTNMPTSGDLACFERDGQVQYVWTQHELRVLVQWLASDNAVGLSYWRTWTSTLNAAEKALLASLPAIVDDHGACSRAPDLYYPQATAFLACPPPSGAAAVPVYYAAFPDASAFPNDPMTTEFDAIMTGGGWPDDTQTGCFDKEPTYGRYTWGFSDASGKVGPAEGYLGCFLRTEPDALTQLVWTYNKAGIMGLWAAPDLQTGVDYFNKEWLTSLPH